MEKPVKPPGKRRLARELAVQFLYQFDLGGGSLKEALPLFWETQPGGGEMTISLLRAQHGYNACPIFDFLVSKYLAL